MKGGLCVHDRKDQCHLHQSVGNRGCARKGAANKPSLPRQQHCKMLDSIVKSGGQFVDLQASCVGAWLDRQA
eukprot:1117640-Pelagomonas_calceolata.AAC.3